MFYTTTLVSGLKLDLVSAMGSFVATNIDCSWLPLRTTDIHSNNHPLKSFCQ
jgi:hypothetical protein